MSEKDKHKTFAWEYFDRGISKSSKGVTDEVKFKNCSAVIKCTGESTSGLLRHLKSKHSIEKPSSTQSDVSSDTQSASSTKCFVSDYSQATLHSFMNKITREEIIAKLVAYVLYVLYIYLCTICTIYILMYYIDLINTQDMNLHKLVAVDGLPPSAVCESEFICQAFGDKGML